MDTGNGWWEPTADGRQRWREDAIRGLLAAEDLAGSIRCIKYFQAEHRRYAVYLPKRGNQCIGTLVAWTHRPGESAMFVLRGGMVEDHVDTKALERTVRIPAGLV